jgi:hypothetical protein
MCRREIHHVFHETNLIGCVDVIAEHSRRYGQFLTGESSAPVPCSV